MKVQRATPGDADALTAIAFAAKRHWGYPDDWIQRWKVALTVTPEYIRSHPTYAAIANQRIAGFCAFQLKSGAAFLEHLWVEPGSIRRGVGRALFGCVEQLARDGGASRIEIESDPHARGFYEEMGATVYGAEPAAMDDHPRFLPLLRKELRQQNP